MHLDLRSTWLLAGLGVSTSRIALTLIRYDSARWRHSLYNIICTRCPPPRGMLLESVRFCWSSCDMAEHEVICKAQPRELFGAACSMFHRIHCGMAGILALSSTLTVPSPEIHEQCHKKGPCATSLGSYLSVWLYPRHFRIHGAVMIA